MKLTDKDIEKACDLSKIALTQTEKSTIQKELVGIFEWIEKLNKVNVDDVDLHAQDADARMVEHNDTIDTTNYVGEILKNAPLASHNMIAVPKVIE